ncbi:IS630 family transposase [Pseudomonas aeruginosa]|uniref:IS630 family transposase n=1 Tax=Pseudomonadaceae TaxID=135621 RepID=UPI00071038ED|nr:MULTISPECIES: IS630 family transposase [Pseudomonadaceae]PBW56568.1 IS630 family transposase [Pseudomonas aeruginosa]
MAKPAACFVLTPSDHATLQSWLRMGSLAQNLVQRARILLLLADGVTPKEISEQLLISAPVVFKWRKRYLADGLEGLNDLPRSGQPRKLSAQKVNEILTLTTRRVPREATHWSVRLMAKYAGVTTWQVRQVWAASDLKPHRLKTFKISNDPHFADKVVDVVGLYLNPPDNALVLSVDEKTQIQALDRTQPMLPLRPGQIERRTHDYKRHGTASLYAAFDILTGKVIGRITQRHRAKEFLAFLQQIDRSTPAELDLHVILDNSSTHKTPAIKQWLEKHPRFKLHFTPTSASWLNAVEGWFAQLERRALYRGVFTSVADLKTAIRHFIEAHNELCARPFKWNKTAESIISSVHKAKLGAMKNRLLN